MNDEIREILDRIETASEIFDCLLKPEECTELLDYITNLQQNCLLEIDQLTNNWNELEEYIKNEWKVVAKSPDGSFYDGYDTCMEEMKEDILDKMKEIKEENK